MTKQPFLQLYFMVHAFGASHINSHNQGIPVLTFSPEHRNFNLVWNNVNLLKYLAANTGENLPTGFRCHRRVLVINTFSRFTYKQESLLPTTCLHSMWKSSKLVSNLQASTSLILLKESTMLSTCRSCVSNSHPLNYSTWEECHI